MLKKLEYSWEKQHKITKQCQVHGFKQQSKTSYNFFSSNGFLPRILFSEYIPWAEANCENLSSIFS